MNESLRFATAIIALVFAALVLVSGQLFIERGAVISPTAVATPTR